MVEAGMGNTQLSHIINEVVARILFEEAGKAGFAHPGDLRSFRQADRVLEVVQYVGHHLLNNPRSILVKIRHIVGAGERCALRRLGETANECEKQHQPVKTVGVPNFLHQHGPLTCRFSMELEPTLPGVQQGNDLLNLWKDRASAHEEGRIKLQDHVSLLRDFAGFEIADPIVWQVRADRREAAWTEFADVIANESLSGRFSYQMDFIFRMIVPPRDAAGESHASANETILLDWMQPTQDEDFSLLYQSS